jgi:hypothetical protein
MFNGWKGRSGYAGVVSGRVAALQFALPSEMRTLTIEANSAESAHGFIEALSAFDAVLIDGEDDRYYVKVSVRGDDQEVVHLLNTLEQHVTERARGPAQIEVEGQSYTMHPRSA